MSGEASNASATRLQPSASYRFTMRLHLAAPAAFSRCHPEN